MKIVHIHQYYNDNMGYHENILPDYQAKLGHDVILITSTLSNGFNGDIREKSLGEYQDKGFKVKRIGIRGEFKNRFVLFKDLAQYLEQERPDYIYHHSIAAPSLLTVYAYKKKYPQVFLVVDNHADLINSGKNKIYKTFYYNILWKKVLKYIDNSIDLYFGVTPLRCEFLVQELGIKENKIRLLPIGTEINYLTSDDSKNDILRELNIPENKILIIHGGKITPEKQTGKILQAFSNISNEKIRFIIFGKIEDSQVESLIKKDKRILYVGWLERDKVLQLFNRVHIGIWGSHHTTLIEDAVGMQLPLILEETKNVTHLVKKNGVLIQNATVEKFENVLSNIVNNEQLIKEYKVEAKKISQLIDYTNIAKQSIEYMEKKS